jgi:hypothetical protein
MTSRLALGAGVALAAVITLASPWSVTEAHAYQCKTATHQAVAVRNLKLAATSAARQAWTATAKSQFGLSWSLWSIAQNKSVDCEKLNTGGWRCLGSAKPCNYVVQ